MIGNHPACRAGAFELDIMEALATADWGAASDRPAGLAGRGGQPWAVEPSPAHLHRHVLSHSYNRTCSTTAITVY